MTGFALVRWTIVESGLGSVVYYRVDNPIVPPPLSLHVLADSLARHCIEIPVSISLCLTSGS
jgi:hypothetical protein